MVASFLRAGLAAVAAFFLALAAGDAFAASGVLLDGAGGATALFVSFHAVVAFELVGYFQLIRSSNTTGINF